jgi:hypothetical protein
MAYIDNSDLKKEINDAIRGNSVSNIAPSVVGQQVIPVFETNPKLLKEVTVYSLTSSSTGGNFVTTPAVSTGKFFYITHALFHILKDAVCDLSTANASTGINFTLDGKSTYICRPATITLTAQDSILEVDFVNPIKVDAGTTISGIRGATSAGVCVVTGEIAGFIA